MPTPLLRNATGESLSVLCVATEDLCRRRRRACPGTIERGEETMATLKGNEGE